MSKARQNVLLTANLLKTTLGLEMTPEEAKLEEKHTPGESILDHLSPKTTQFRVKK